MAVARATTPEQYYDAPETPVSVPHDYHEKVLDFLRQGNRMKAVQLMQIHIRQPKPLEPRTLMVMHPPVVWDSFYKVNSTVIKDSAQDMSKQFEKALGILIDFASVLLKPLTQRPPNWNRIQFTYAAYQKLAFFLGHELILIAMGYSMVESEGFHYEKPIIHTESVISVLADLLTLKVYLMAHLPGKLGDATVVVKRTPRKVHTVVVEEPVTPPSPSQGIFCDICGEPAVFWKCAQTGCENKAWCGTCDKKWHTNNPARQKHARLPCPKPPPIPPRSSIGPKVSFDSEHRKSNGITHGKVKGANELPISMATSSTNPFLSMKASGDSHLVMSSSSTNPFLQTDFTENSFADNRDSNSAVTSIFHDAVSDWPYKHPPMSQSLFDPKQDYTPEELRNIPPPTYSPPSLPASTWTSPVPINAFSKPKMLKSVHEISTEILDGYKKKVRDSQSPEKTLLKCLNEEKVVLRKLQEEYDNDTQGHDILAKQNELNAHREVLDDLEQLEKSIHSRKQQTETEEAEKRRLEDERAAKKAQELEKETSVYIPQPPPKPKFIDTKALDNITKALQAGFTLEEVELSTVMSHSANPISWLRNGYKAMQKTVMDILRNNYKGINFSKEEVKQVILFQYHSDIEVLIDQKHGMLARSCAERRAAIVAALMEKVKAPELVTEQFVNQCYTQSDYDESETLLRMYSKACEKMRQFIWTPTSPDQLIEAEGKMYSKCGIDILQDKDADKNVRKMLAASELNLADEQVDEAIHLLDTERTDDHTFNVFDVLTAVSYDITGKSGGGIHHKAKKYLSHECAGCFSLYPKSQIANLTCHDDRLEEKFCRACAAGYFDVMIKEKKAKHFKCPVCEHPPAGGPSDDEDKLYERHTYFENLLNSTFPNIGLSEVSKSMFEKKVLDWNNERDPNFRWCVKQGCEGGFIVNANQFCGQCPECFYVYCVQCKLEWQDQHQGITCEAFQQWLREDDENFRNQALDEHLSGILTIKCPVCPAKFALDRGGCEHYTCAECKTDFCRGCFLVMTKRPNPCLRVDLDCGDKSLHCHHPRNCLYYLRDEDIEDLEKLLTDENIGLPEGDAAELQCTVMTTQEVGGVPENCAQNTAKAGMCERHYKEALVKTINDNNIDPVSILSLLHLRQTLTRERKDLPDAGSGSFQTKLREAVMQELPLVDLSS